MPSQVIAFETTEVSVTKTVAEIEAMLQRCNATKTAKEFESGSIKALYFQMETPNGTYPFMLPVNVAAVYQLLLNKRRESPRYRWSIPQDVQARLHEQAERTAWRIIHWWVKAQLALVQTQMVTVTEIFLPYMLMDGRQTLYQKLISGEMKALLPGVTVSANHE